MRPNLIVVIVVIEGHVWHRFETNVFGKVVEKSNHHCDGNGTTPKLCCERWILDSKSDSVIFFSVCGPQWVPASWLAALPAGWSAGRQDRADSEGRADGEVQKGERLKCREATANAVLEWGSGCLPRCNDAGRKDDRRYDRHSHFFLQHLTREIGLDESK